MRRNATKVAAVVMSLAVTMTSVNLPTTAAAATKKVKLNKTKATLTVGKTTTLKVTKGGKAVKATFKSNKPKIAKVVTKSGKSTKIKALKKGTAKITATYAKKKYTCKITVKAKKVTATTKPTTAPTAAPTVEPTVEPTVTPATAGAITATLTNALTGYEDKNIVLAGTTAKVQVKLTGADGKPAANKIVTASISAESGYAYYQMNGTSLVTTVTTNSEGVADVYVAPVVSMKNTDSDYVGKYTIKLMGDSVEAKEIGFGVAALSFDKLEEKKDADAKVEDAKKVPGTNAKDRGITRQSGRTITTATTYDKYKTPTNNSAEYVATQQVSSEGVDHAVTFKTGVSIKLPADIDKVATSYVQPVDVKSGNYSTYENRGDFIEFKLENKDDVKYATLLFNKLSVSKNTKITVYKANSKDDVKRSEPALATYDITNVTNDNGNYLTTNQALQIPVSVINEYKGVYVQIDSEGQVDTSCREGYDISKITYVYNKKTAEKTETLKGVKVNWETVKDVTYTTNRKLTPTDTEDYANIVDAAANQSATYTMPVFPYTGDAIITVCDASNKPVKYFAVATANKSAKVKDAEGQLVNGYGNENEIIKTAKAYQISKDEADRTVNGTVGDIVADKTTDTSVTVDSKQSGTTFVKGTLSADGVEFDEANKYVYTSVMWNPIPNAEKAQDTFYAIEGQTIKVTAQLKDRNGNAASIAGKKITFKDLAGNLNVNATVGVSEKANSDNSAKATVIDISNDGVTDANGQVVLTMKAAAAANVYDVTATSGDTNYTVSLVFGDNSSAEKATLKWLGLGLSYKNSVLNYTIGNQTVIAKEIKTTDNADGRVATADSTSYKAGETWEVASKVYAYEAAKDGGDVLKKDGNIVRYNVSGVKVNAKKESNSVGDIKDTDVNGRVTLASKANGTGKLDFVVNNVSGNDAKFKIDNVEKVSIGTGVVSSDEKLTVAYNFGVLAPQIAFVTDMGIKAVSGSSIDAYIRLTDTLGNAIPETPINVKTNKGTVNGVANDTVEVKTDKNGIAYVTVRQADLNQKYVTITADCKVKSDAITASQTYEFVQKKVDNFTLAKAFDTNNNVIAEKDATYNVSTTGGYDTITLRFTDDVLASSAIKAVFNSSKVTVKDVNDGTPNEYTVTNVAVSGDKVTLTLNVHLTNLSDEALITVTPASVFVGGVGYELTSVSGQKFNETNKIEFKKSNLQ